MTTSTTFLASACVVADWLQSSQSCVLLGFYSERGSISIRFVAVRSSAGPRKPSYNILKMSKTSWLEGSHQSCKYDSPKSEIAAA